MAGRSAFLRSGVIKTLVVGRFARSLFSLKEVNSEMTDHIKNIESHCFYSAALFLCENKITTLSMCHYFILY